MFVTSERCMCDLIEIKQVNNHGTNHGFIHRKYKRRRFATVTYPVAPELFLLVDIAFVDGSSADHHKLSRWEVAGRRSRQIEQSHLLEDAPQKPGQWPSPKQMNTEDGFGFEGLLSLYNRPDDQRR